MQTTFKKKTILKIIWKKKYKYFLLIGDLNLIFSRKSGGYANAVRRVIRKNDKDLVSRIVWFCKTFFDISHSFFHIPKARRSTEKF